MRNEKLASEQKKERYSFDLSSRRREEKEKRRKEKSIIDLVGKKHDPSEPWVRK
jgi:hypothetical protein